MPEQTSQHLFSNTKGCKGIQGASLLHNQTGGGLGTKSHAVDNFNHASASSYGFDEQGAAVSHELRGSYAAMTKNFDRNFCGGRKRRRKTNKRKKKTKRRRKKTKRRRKYKKRRRKHNKRLTRYKKSRSNKRRRRRRTKRRSQKGGASISYSTLNKNLIGNDARILGTNSLMVNNKTCGDNYNHYTGGKSKSLY